MLTRRVDRLVLLRIATIGLSLERGTGRGSIAGRGHRPDLPFDGQDRVKSVSLKGARMIYRDGRAG